MAYIGSPSAIAIILLLRLLHLRGGLSGAKAAATTTVCVTEEQCRQQFESMDMPGSFYVGDLTTKGCFLKGDNGFFGTGSTSDAEMATTDLPGVQERIWCDISDLIIPPQEEEELATLAPSGKPTTIFPTFEIEAEVESDSDSTSAPSSSFSPSSQPPKKEPPTLSQTKAPSTPLLTKKPTPVLDQTKQPAPPNLDDIATNSPSILSISPSSDAFSTLLPTITLSPSSIATAITSTTTDDTASPSPIVVVNQPSTAPTQKPSYEKALPFSGPIQCNSLLSTEKEPPILDGIADEWTNVTVYHLPLTSASNPTKPFPYGNGAVQMQCVYDTEKAYFVFYVPGMYGEGEDHQMNAAISTMFKMGAEASLSNMGDCPTADDCTTALEACESYKVDWQLLSSQTSSTIDDKYSVSLECRYDDDVDADSGGGNEWEGAWMHYNLTASSSGSSSDGEETTTTNDSSSTKINLITMAEVRKHNSEDELWMVLENKVYDFTEYAPIHPGGPRYLTMYAGMDGTDPFQAVHYGVYARAETKEFYIGDLDMSSVDEWVFEMSRPLKTDSMTTDAQFVEGQSIDFGFSFWDPFETEERGWTTSGYYTTGSTKDWTSIQFGEQTSSGETKIESTNTTIISARTNAASLTSSFLSCTKFMLLLVLSSTWRVL